MLFMSYDQSGFLEALKSADSNGPELTFQDELIQLANFGLHDLVTNHCESFEIYNTQGEVVFKLCRSDIKVRVA